MLTIQPPGKPLPPTLEHLLLNRLVENLLPPVPQRDYWAEQRRANQTPPDGDWSTWVVMAGRGFGKTRTGAEWIREQVMAGGPIRAALVAPTAADARDVMVQGESGLLACCERYGIRATYKSSLRRVDFPNGAMAFLYSADEPDRLRGPQHHVGWSDEAAAWRYPDTWDMFQFGLRLGDHPRSVVTTTPKPVHLVRQLIKQSQDGVGDVVITHGSTFDNSANLAPTFLTALKARYEGTRLGRQEISGELLTDVEGALWSYTGIDETRRERLPDGVALARILVAVDPPASSGTESAECGIVVTGIGSDGHYYVLDDRSLRATPNEWARHAWSAFDEHLADSVVIEVNQGGDMATNTLRTIRPDGPIKSVHASRGKFARAEPISALYEQRRVHHLGIFPALEDQMCTWIPDGRHASPDRLDALVWGLTELNGGLTGDLMVGW